MLFKTHKFFTKCQQLIRSFFPRRKRRMKRWEKKRIYERSLLDVHVSQTYNQTASNKLKIFIYLLPSSLSFTFTTNKKYEIFKKRRKTRTCCHCVLTGKNVVEWETRFVAFLKQHFFLSKTAAFTTYSNLLSALAVRTNKSGVETLGHIHFSCVKYVEVVNDNRHALNRFIIASSLAIRKTKTKLVAIIQNASAYNVYRRLTFWCLISNGNLLTRNVKFKRRWHHL